MNLTFHVCPYILHTGPLKLNAPQVINRYLYVNCECQGKPWSQHYLQDLIYIQYDSDNFNVENINYLKKEKKKQEVQVEVQSKKKSKSLFKQLRQTSIFKCMVSVLMSIPYRYLMINLSVCLCAYSQLHPCHISASCRVPGSKETYSKADLVLRITGLPRPALGYWCG